MRKTNIIKAGTASWQKYQLPEAQEHEESFPPPERIQDVIASEEHNNGFQTGYEEGIEQARREGHQTGYTEGLEKGKAAGLLQGQEQGLRQGTEQGYQQGKEQGYKDGRSESENDLQMVLQNLDLNLNNIQQYYHSRKQELSYWLAALVEEISRQVIRTELKLQPGQILHVVNETIQYLPDDSSQMTIRMHPDDIHRLRQYHADFSSSWTLLEDESVSQGDCQVESDQAEARASMEDRLAACMDIIRETIPAELEMESDRSMA